MGLDFLAATIILHEHKYRPIKGRVLTIGRQSIGVTGDQLDRLLTAYGIPKTRDHVYRSDGDTVGVARTDDTISQESFFGAFTDAEVRSLDVSDYENADYVCDLQGTVPEKLHGIADFVYNGSCLDNIFDAAAAMRNMSLLLRKDGRVYHYEQGNSHPTAYLKYSADWFMDFYALNQFADCKTYVCDKPSSLAVPLIRRANAKPARIGLKRWVKKVLKTILLRKADGNAVRIGRATPSTRQHPIIIYNFNPLVDNGYDCSSVEAMSRYEIHCIAEKGPDATIGRNPIQKHYRVDAEHYKICYERVVRFNQFPRPLYSNPFPFDADRIPRINSSDFPEVMKPVGVLPHHF